jgi:hypothetical protein
MTHTHTRRTHMENKRKPRGRRATPKEAQEFLAIYDSLVEDWGMRNDTLAEAVGFAPGGGLSTAIGRIRRKGHGVSYRMVVQARALIHALQETMRLQGHPPAELQYALPVADGTPPVSWESQQEPPEPLVRRQEIRVSELPPEPTLADATQEIDRILDEVLEAGRRLENLIPHLRPYFREGAKALRDEILALVSRNRG